MPIEKDDAKQTFNLIEQFIKNASGYLAYRKAVRQLGACLPRTDPGSPAEAANLKHLERRHKLEMDAKQAAVATGGNLTKLLARRGEHAILTSLRQWLHFVDGGGGPDNAYPIWPNLKVSLQCLADLIETDPFDSLLVAVDGAKAWTLDLIRRNENTPKGQGWVTHSELDIAQDFYGPVYRKAVALADTHKLEPPPVFSSPAWVAFDKLTTWVKAAKLSQEQEQEQPARHSPDFRSVHWYGTDYTFTATQAAVVEILWEAWENGTPNVSDARLLTEIETNQRRLADIFKKQGKPIAAWGAMIVQGETKGTRRLDTPIPPQKK